MALRIPDKSKAPEHMINNKEKSHAITFDNPEIIGRDWHKQCKKIKEIFFNCLCILSNSSFTLSCLRYSMYKRNVTCYILNKMIDNFSLFVNVWKDAGTLKNKP